MRMVVLTALLILLATVMAAAPQPTRALSGVESDAQQTFFNDTTIESGQVYDGDVVVFSGDVTVDDGGVIRGNLVAYSGDVEVEEGGLVEGDLTSWSGSITIDGRVNGNVSAVSGDIELTDSASIGGDVSAVSGDIDRDDRATVGGNIVRGPKLGSLPGLGALNKIAPSAPVAPVAPTLDLGRPTLFSRLLALIGRMLGAFFTALAATLLMVLAYYVRPAVFDRAAATMKANIASNLVTGLVVNLGLGLIILLLTVTFCLACLTPIPGLALIVLNFLGFTVVALVFGQRLTANATRTPAQPIVQLAIGALLSVGALSFLWALFGWGAFRWPMGFVALLVGAPGVGAFIQPWLKGEWSWSQRTSSRAAATAAATPSAPVKVIVPHSASSYTSQAPSSATTLTPAAAPAVEPTVDATAAQATAALSEGTAVVEATEVMLTGLPLAAPVAGAVEDDLTRIAGIGRTFEQRLKAAAITSYGQLLVQTPESLAALLGITPEQVVGDDLLGQAAKLAAGGLSGKE